MYRVKSTFGITTPVNHDRVVSFIDGELNNMDWYKENRHIKVALSVPGYIVGYCLFNYAIPKPDKDLLHLYFQIIESEYFKSLGFTIEYYNPLENKFNKRNIKRSIEAIVEANKPKYTKLNPDLGSLKYTSLVDFAKSYLKMISNLDMTKAK